MPPVAVCSMSMCVALSSEEKYCFVWRVMVASEMALRVNQETPWRERTGSGSSERVLFCVIEKSACVDGEIERSS
jgi:hypothetical protein